MKRVLIPFVAALLIIVFALGYLYFFSPVTTVIIARHAERLNSTDTSSLSPEGWQRASELLHVVGSARISRIYVSEYVRTLQTVQPTAAALGLAPVQIPAAGIDWLIDSIEVNKGKTILIIGHSDTIPLIIEKLGYTPPPSIAGNEFDNLFVVTLSRFYTSLLHLKYGDPT